MPDLDPLPPLPRRPSLPPRPGDFDDMERRVRRRRRGRYAGAGSAVGVAAALAFAMTVTPGTAELVADPATPAGRTATPAPSATPSGETTPSPVGEPSPSASAGVSGTPGATPPPPTATAAPSPTATAVPPGPSREPAPVHASLRRELVAYRTGPCSTGAGGEAPMWCFRTPGDTTTQSDLPVEYVYEACRLPGSGRGQVTFVSREEIYFYVDGDTATYGWGRGGRDDPSYTVNVEAGRCLRWVFTWDGTDQRGRPLPAGRYDGSAGFDALFSGWAVGSTTWGFTLTIVE